MRDGFRVLDSDIHLMEPREFWADCVDPAFRDRAPKPPTDRPGIWEVEGKVIPPHMDNPARLRAWRIRMERAQRTGPMAHMSPESLRAGTQPQEMLDAMETEGVDVAVVFRTWAQHVVTIDGMEPAFAAALCRGYNRWLHEFCSLDPARLKPAALLPMHDPELAAAEAQFAREELGAVTLIVPSQMVESRPLYHADYDRLWATVQDLGLSISIHGIHSAYNEHLGTRYMDNLPLGHAAGQTVELMLALGAVVTGGVLARFPQLRFAFLEGNCSWLPWWLWALDERWEKWGDEEYFKQNMKPSELFLRQRYLSIEPEEETARHVIAALGDDNFVVSTDWPHDDSCYPHAIETFLAMPDLSDESKRKILWDNCATLYGIE